MMYKDVFDIKGLIMIMLLIIHHFLSHGCILGQTLEVPASPEELLEELCAHFSLV